MLQDVLHRPITLGPVPHGRAADPVRLAVENFSFWYGSRQALRDVSLTVTDREITAFIGPSGCGKSTLLQAMNRSNDFIDGVRRAGRITLDGVDIYDPGIDPPAMRRRFGWIAQKPNPFPKSIRENILYGPRIHGLLHDLHRDELVERVLKQAGLWAEVKDRLGTPGTDLSIGQQQRLCIARALAYDPEIILMDEPCSALDPVSTAVVEDLIVELGRSRPVVVITHNMQQAARVAQRVAFFHLGSLVEFGDAEEIFTNPRTAQCQRFITGQYG